jgi:hypothetical protein
METKGKIYLGSVLLTSYNLSDAQDFTVIVSSTVETGGEASQAVTLTMPSAPSRTVATAVALI